MTPEDPPIPDDDAVAVAARGALGRLTGPDGALAPWDEVRARGRRVQVMRYATVAAACLLVVVAGVGTVSAANGNGDRVDVAGNDPGHATTTTSSATSTTTTTTTTSPSQPPPTGGPPPPTTPGTAAEPSPTAVDFAGTVVVSRSPSPGEPAYVGEPVNVGESVDVGEPVIVTTMIYNISDREIWPSSTLVPTALATVCQGEAPDARSLWWITSPPVRPGEQTGRDGTFVPTENYVGAVTCQLFVVLSNPVGDAFDTSAGGDEARNTIIGPVVGVPPVTFTVVASSATTVPESTTTTAPGEPAGP